MHKHGPGCGVFVAVGSGVSRGEIVLVGVGSGVGVMVGVGGAVGMGAGWFKMMGR